MGTELDYHQAKAALLWQMELGADEAIADAPLNRYAEAETRPAAADSAPKRDPERAAVAPAPPVDSAVDPVADARAMAGAAQDLDALRDAMALFPHCELKRGARNLVFADGNPEARVMVIGEAPGRDEDLKGLPFVGRAGQLLDRMFDAIGMGRTHPDAARALYITNVLPWRPPQNRDPSPEEVAMMMPFLARHVELAGPEILVLMGNHACQALLGRKGITRLRGTWAEALGRPALPMFHPAYLLRNPHAKREAWADLLDLQARLEA
jgi:uracil-DNA glycosylase family 4